MANEVKMQSSSMLVVANDIMVKLQNYEKLSNLTYSDYSRTCVDNMFSKLNDLLLDNGLNWGHFNSQAGVNNLFSAVKYVANMELNVTNSEVAISFRNKNVDGVKTQLLDYRIQGVGNDQILRRFGRNVVDVRSYIVREGDEFTPPYMDGFDYVLPKWKPMYKSQKAIYAVYLIKLKNGDIDVTMGTRDDVKISLLSHIEDSNRYDKKYTKELKERLEKATLDDLISGEFSDFDMSQDKYGKPSKLISNKAYVGSNRERMVERKMRNWALRKWSHNLNFDKKALLDTYVEGFDEEDRYDKKEPTKVVEYNEVEFEEKNSSVEVVEENVGKDVGEEIVEVAEKIEDSVEEQLEEIKEEKEELPSWLND